MVGSGRRTRGGRWWARALLPLLLLRALIPAGFMPAVGAGSLALVFCEPAALAAGAHAAAHHHGHGDTGHSGHLASAECPFAQSAAPALPTLAALPPAQPLVAHVAATTHAQSILPAAPPRHTAARGPPALS
jgi:hypothetical protein